MPHRVPCPGGTFARRLPTGADVPPGRTQRRVSCCPRNEFLGYLRLSLRDNIRVQQAILISFTGIAVNTSIYFIHYFI